MIVVPSRWTIDGFDSALALGLEDFIVRHKIRPLEKEMNHTPGDIAGSDQLRVSGEPNKVTLSEALD